MKKNKATLVLILALIASTSCTKCDKTTKPEVKSIIFMIGDGMGLSQVTMSMIENGYKPTIFNQAQNIALQKNYSSNNRVTDSAASGTALASGKKTNNGMLGVTPDSTACESIASAASKQGKSTGVISTSNLQHATPAAFYAHVPSRNNYNEIAVQLSNSSLDLAIGGGFDYMQQEENGVTLADKMKNKGFELVTNMEELAAASSAKLLGLMSKNHMSSILGGRDSNYLSLATGKAIETLSKNENGFFLMVEGSQIDWAGHDNNAESLLAEQQDFERAVKVAVDYANKTPGVLVVVSADHETGGMAIISNETDFTLSDSGVEYKFATKGHSGTLIPIYLYGTGAEEINGIMENTELNEKMRNILGL